MAKPTYKELMTLAKSADFLDRITMAVTFYAEYIINEDQTTNNHDQRINWAKSAVKSPGTTAGQIAQAVALDGIFKDQDPLNLGTTPDTGAGSVQAATEATINTYIIRY